MHGRFLCLSSGTAVRVAQLFVDHVGKLHKFPRSITADRDPMFVNAFWRRFVQWLGIERNMATVKDPEADGQTGRTNRMHAQYLWFCTKRNPNAWLHFLPCAEYVFNTIVLSSTGCSPAPLVYTKAPLGDLALDAAVGSQPCLKASENFMEQLVSTREFMKEQG